MLSLFLSKKKGAWLGHIGFGRFVSTSVPRTVKLGDKERFDKQQLGVKEPFPVTKLLHKDKEHLALRNNFRVTKKFLITKFDCIMRQIDIFFKISNA